jgi:hypothetical protein
MEKYQMAKVIAHHRPEPTNIIPVALSFIRSIRGTCSTENQNIYEFQRKKRREFWEIQQTDKLRTSFNFKFVLLNALGGLICPAGDPSQLAQKTVQIINKIESCIKDNVSEADQKYQMNVIRFEKNSEEQKRKKHLRTSRICQLHSPLSQYCLHNRILPTAPLYPPWSSL